MKAIGYIRVSTDEQASEGVSLDNQCAKIKAYAALHDMVLLDIIPDRGISAKAIKGRDGAQAVIDMAKAGAVQAVIVYKLDRMFRNAAEALSVTTEFRKAGVALHSVTESIDTDSAMGRFFFTIMAACAEMERNLISERTRDALRYKKSKGEVYNHIPYGYREECGRLAEYGQEQAHIKSMRILKEGGMTLQEIADLMNKNRIPAKRGGKWHPKTVSSALRDHDFGAGAKE